MLEFVSSLIAEQKESILSGATLGAAILSTWLSTKKNIPLILYISSMMLGLYAGRISMVGLLFLSALGASCLLLSNGRLSYNQKLCFKFLITLLSAASIEHLLPGIYNLKIIDNFQIEPGSIPYNLYINFDSASVGFFLILTQIPLSRTVKDWKKALSSGLYFGAIAVFALMLLTYLFGFVDFSFKIPPFSPVFVFINLLFTCVTQEAFFRGFIQDQLSRMLAVKDARIAALILSSILFGLAHYPGGFMYVFLATIAGLIYGAAYMITKRIEASILTHYILNLVHFFFFSYPALMTRSIS